jgi:hypothetical protein
MKYICINKNPVGTKNLQFQFLPRPPLAKRRPEEFQRLPRGGHFFPVQSARKLNIFQAIKQIYQSIHRNSASGPLAEAQDRAKGQIL